MECVSTWSPKVTKAIIIRLHTSLDARILSLTLIFSHAVGSGGTDLCNISRPVPFPFSHKNILISFVIFLHGSV